MKRILYSLSALAVFLTPVTVFLIVQPIGAQTQDLQQEARQLLEKGKQQKQQGDFPQARENLQQALTIARQIENRQLEGKILYSIGFVYNDMGQFKKALPYYQQALHISQQEKNRALEAATFNNIGEVYRNIKPPKEALPYYQSALPIFKQLGDRAAEATTLNNLGLVYDSIGDFKKALSYYRRALPIHQQEKNRTLEAATLNNIGDVYRSTGQPKEALSYYRRALPISQEVGNRMGEATTLNNLGVVYSSIGQPKKALSYYRRALPIFEQVDNYQLEATTLNNLGVVYWSIGQPQEALSYYEKALPIFEQVGDRAREAVSLNTIGAVYSSIRQPKKALSYYRRALPIHQQLVNRDGEATTFNSLGAVYSSVGQLKKALSYYRRALSIHQQLVNRAGEATTLSNIGLIYGKIGQLQEALSYYRRALPIHQQVGNRAGEANTINSLGAVYSSIGQPKKALSYYRRALPIRQQVGDRAGEAISLSNLGSVYQNINQPSRAIDYTEQSFSITLEMRRGLVRENRQQFLEAESGAAIALTDLLIKQDKPDQAFEWINLATTADLADYNRLIDAKVANPEAQEAIEDWQSQNQKLEILRQQLQDEFSAEKARQMRELEAKVNRQAEKIANTFPEVAELFETQPTDIEQLRNNIPQDTLVIQPVLLTNVTNVSNTIAFFLLTQNTLEVIQSDINPNEYDGLLDEYLKQLEDRQNTDVFATSAKLYEILIRPIEAQIEANSPKHLAIITTGKLRYLPFETLFDEKTDQHLIEKYPIHYLTNISTRSPNPSPNHTSSLQALSLANPQPTPDDLKGTEAEAKHLQDNFPGSEAYIGAEATLDTFKTQASRFPILHLGTHGCFDPDGCPNLGMAANTILFANNEQYDIANAALLGLQNTELITLAACQTAKKANAEGKEISGLAYIFERAGAKSVIASLWNVEDNIGSEIMTQFYNNLQQGMSKSEAMRQAKLSQIDSHPWFWSPLILVGDASK